MYVGILITFPNDYEVSSMNLYLHTFLLNRFFKSHPECRRFLCGLLSSHGELIQQENRGNHEQATLRWAVGWFMDELVERRIENNFE